MIEPLAWTRVLTLTLHPLIQAVATLLAFYVLFLGVDRFRQLHLHQKTRFRWKRHVRLGRIVFGLWGGGVLIGLVMMKVQWQGVLLTGDHGERSILLLPLLLVGLLSGWYMERRKKRRLLLPLYHAFVNVVLLGLVLQQVYSGWFVYDSFVLGG